MVSTSCIHTTLVFALLCIFINSVAADSGWEGSTEEEWMGTSNCFDSNSDIANLMSRIFSGEIVNSTKAMDDKLCQNTEEVARGMECYMNEFLTRIPLEARDTIHGMMPDRAKWVKAVDLLCANRDTLATGACFDSTEDQFGKCLNQEASDVVQSIESPSREIFEELVRTFTGIIHSCLRRYHGTCDEAFVDTVKQFVDIILPYNPGNGAMQAGATVLLVVASIFLGTFENIL